MAATTQLAAPARASSPIALWHLLSLDAPTVAALWTWFVARASHIRLPLAVPASMALAVWILYAADRLLDAAHAAPEDIELRHHFHHRHRRAFLVGVALAAAALAALLPHLDPAAIRLYLLEGTLLAAWFLAIHTTRNAYRLPKEIAVGLFFSAAVFIPTVAREPAQRLSLLLAAAFFAGVCSLNCLFIYAWERRPKARAPHASTRTALAHLPALAKAAAFAGATPALIYRTPVPAACSLAAVSLLTLHNTRHNFTRTHLRAAADIALLTPAILLPFLR